MANLTIGGVIAAVRRLDAPTTDAELLGRFVASRDDDAFAQLVTRYGGLVLGTCRRIVPDAHLAEDAFQATFLVVATKAASLDGTRPIGPWLYTVACNVAVRAQAMVGRRRKREVLSARLPSVPVLSVEQDDTTTILDEEIGKLSAVCREAVVLCELQGLSRKEAAIQLGIAEGTLSSRLAAARKTLASRLRARGVTGPLVFAGIVVPASLASAAVASARGSASAVVVELSKGALQAMLLSKLKLASVLAVVGVLVIGIGGWARPLAGSIVRASVPAALPDLGLIWLHNTQANKLLAYSPDGKQRQEVTLNDRVRFLGFNEEGTKLLLAGKGTEGAGHEKSGGLTLHLQDVGAKAKPVDTGLAYRSSDMFVIAPDGKRIVRQRLTKLGDGTSYHQYSHVLFDLTTRKETPLRLASNQQVMQWSGDGQAWRVFEFNLRKSDTIPSCRWLSVPVNGDKSVSISDAYSLNWLDPAPNGKSFLATGHQHPNVEPAGPSVFRLNATTGNAARIKTFENTAFAIARRSLDDKQIVVMRYDFDRGGQCVGDAHLLVFDADGKNEKTLLDLSNDQQQTVLLGWFPSASVATREIPEFFTSARGDEPSTRKDEKAKVIQSTAVQAAVPAPVALGNSPGAKELAEIYRATTAAVSGAKGSDVGKLSIETATKLVAHARKYPTDDSSLDGLVSALSYSTRSPDGVQIGNEAVAVMKQNFAGSSALRRHLRILASGMSDTATNFVREIIKSHPDKQMRALAAMRRIKALEFRVRYAEHLNADAARRLEYEERIGKEPVARLLAEAPEMKRDIETYRTLLRTELKDQLPSLEVGSVAPETVSVNLEGKQVKLSELRGKVVVLDFWAVWCGPCRALFPHIRELVKDFRGKPFEFVGICIDEEKKTLTEFLEKESLPWTHWWDGKKTVTEQWDIAGFPTFFVIDHKGVIHFSSLGYDPKSRKLEALIKELVKAAEGGK